MKSLQDIYTGKIYANEAVLAVAPRHKYIGEIEFFSVGEYISDNELEKEYEKRGLIPADPFHLARYMEAHKDEDWKATHWKDAEDKWCYAAFDRWGDERRVRVGRRGNGWLGRWSFAGVRKSPSTLDVETSDTLNLEARVEALEAWRERVQQP